VFDNDGEGTRRRGSRDVEIESVMRCVAAVVNATGVEALDRLAFYMPLWFTVGRQPGKNAPALVSFPVALPNLSMATSHGGGVGAGVVWGWGVVVMCVRVWWRVGVGAGAQAGACVCGPPAQATGGRVRQNGRTPRTDNEMRAKRSCAQRAVKVIQCQAAPSAGLSASR